MAKTRTVYACTECGGESPKWQGQCPALRRVEQLVESVAEAVSKHGLPGWRRARSSKRLSEVSARESPRMGSGIEELDRVLGGGFVAVRSRCSAGSGRGQVDPDAAGGCSPR